MEQSTCRCLCCHGNLALASKSIWNDMLSRERSSEYDTVYILNRSSVKCAGRAADLGARAAVRRAVVLSSRAAQRDALVPKR
eukprot:5007149-Pleurochrysis_carterae.AAC.1